MEDAAGNLLLKYDKNIFEAALDRYDYIRFTYIDIKGIPRSVLLNKENMRKYFQDGIEFPGKIFNQVLSFQ